MRRDERDPFVRAVSVLNQVNRWMDSAFEWHRRPGMAAEGHWCPSTDVYETAEDIVVCMEVAGAEPASIDVNFAGGQLTVVGHRAAGCASGRCHQAEIENGRFSRRVAIPTEIDEEGIRATYRHGLLEISLPRRQAAQPRKIPISDEPEGSDEDWEVATEDSRADSGNCEAGRGRERR